MSGQSLRKVGRGALQLLIGNQKVTEGQTDKGGHKKESKSNPFAIVPHIILCFLDFFVIMNVIQGLMLPPSTFSIQCGDTYESLTSDETVISSKNYELVNITVL